jgi:hypothetical protein
MEDEMNLSFNSKNDKVANMRLAKEATLRYTEVATKSDGADVLE